MKKYPTSLPLTATCGLAALLAFTTVPAAHGALLFYDGFNYAPSSNISGQGGWITTNTGMVTQSTSLAYGTLSTTGGAAISSSPTSETTNLSIATGLATPVSGVRWLSYLAQQTSGIIPYQNANLIIGTEFSGGVGNEMIRVGTNLGDPNPLAGGTGGSYPFFNGGISASFDSGFTGNQAALILVRYDYDNLTINFYINPVLGAAENTLVAFGTLTAGANNLSASQMSIAALSFNAGNVYSGDVLFDEIRIGDTYLDVAPSAIPEPSTAAFFAGILALSLTVLRRSQRPAALA